MFFDCLILEHHAGEITRVLGRAANIAMTFLGSREKRPSRLALKEHLGRTKDRVRPGTISGSRIVPDQSRSSAGTENPRRFVAGSACRNRVDTRSRRRTLWKTSFVPVRSVHGLVNGLHPVLL